MAVRYILAILAFAFIVQGINKARAKYVDRGASVLSRLEDDFNDDDLTYDIDDEVKADAIAAAWGIKGGGPPKRRRRRRRRRSSRRRSS